MAKRWVLESWKRERWFWFVDGYFCHVSRFDDIWYGANDIVEWLILEYEVWPWKDEREQVVKIIRVLPFFMESYLDDFDYEKITAYSEKKITSLLQDKGIIRNKLKVKATVTNAQAFIKIQKEFGSFSKYIWGFVNGKPIVNTFNSLSEIPANTPLSDTISNDLKKRGFKFVGSTVIYAHMQATGMVNDHITSCFRHKEV